MRVYSHPANRKIHFGASGTGKNTDFLPRLKKEKAKWIFIFDHKREFALKLGLPVCETIPQLAVATKKGGYVLFDHQHLYPGDRVSGFKFFAKFVYEVAKELRGRKIIVVDELQDVAGPNDDCPEIITCLDDGRSLQIDAMLIAQSANGIHTRLRAQLTEIFVFRQSDENAIRHLEQNGFDKDAIRSLRPGEWFWRNLNTGKAAKGGRAFEPDTKGVPDGGTAMHRDTPETNRR